MQRVEFDIDPYPQLELPDVQLALLYLMMAPLPCPVLVLQDWAVVLILLVLTVILLSAIIPIETVVTSDYTTVMVLLAVMRMEKLRLLRPMMLFVSIAVWI